jgi:hypothetical protein
MGHLCETFRVWTTLEIKRQTTSPWVFVFVSSLIISPLLQLSLVNHYNYYWLQLINIFIIIFFNIMLDIFYEYK